MRRTLAVSAVAAVLAAAAVPFLGTASAAPCPSWVDAKDDSSTGQLPDPAGVLYDGNLDITSAALAVNPANVTATITSAGLGEAASDAGDEFRVTFMVGDKEMQLYSQRHRAPVNGGAGFYNVTDDVLVTGAAATYDVKSKTVTIVGKTADLIKALGSPIAGKSATGLVAETLDQSGGLTMFFYDEAPAPAGLAIPLEAGCGSAGPAPTPTPTPAPTTSPGPTPGPTPAPGAPPADLPMAGCFHVADPTGDGKINANASNDPDLDLTGMTLRSSNGWLLAYLKADKLANGPTVADGHRYTLEFTFNKTLFTVAASAYKNAASQQIREGLASTGKNGHMVQMSVNSISSVTNTGYVPGQVNPPYVESGSKAVFDTKTSWVTIAVPIADVEKYGKASFTGATPLTGVIGKSSADYWRNSLGADTTAKDNAATSTDNWTLGDNKCFPRPVATALALKVTKAGSSRTVTATLTAAGKPLAGQVVTWFVNGKKAATTTTSPSGTAVLKTAKPTQIVTAEFGGVPDKYLASKATARV